MTTKAQQQVSAAKAAAKTTPPKNDTTPDQGRTTDTTADQDQVHEGRVVDDDPKTHPAETKAETLERLRRQLRELDPDAPELNARDREPTRAEQAKDAPDTRAEDQETREERRARLRQELAEVDQDAQLHGGYKEVPTHIGTLMCGDQVNTTNAAATDHFCAKHNAVVPFVQFHAIPEHLREMISAG